MRLIDVPRKFAKFLCEETGSQNTVCLLHYHLCRVCSSHATSKLRPPETLVVFFCLPFRRNMAMGSRWIQLPPKALGLDMPLTLLAISDEVIERYEIGAQRCHDRLWPVTDPARRAPAGSASSDVPCQAPHARLGRSPRASVQLIS
jgi:hypothetical protein